MPASQLLHRRIRELPGLCINPVSERWASDVNSTADELLKVEFEIPNGFTDMEFAPLGLGWTPQWPIVGHRRTLAMAPFVDDGFVKRFVDSATPLGIVSRAESLDELSGGHISKLFDAWYLNTAADPIPVDSEGESVTAGPDAGGSALEVEARVELTPAVQLHGLHAKLYVSDDGWNSHVWTGSANATGGGQIKHSLSIG